MIPANKSLLKNLSDNDLVNLYQNETSELAFEILLKRHKARVYNTIFQIIKERSSDPQSLAKDLTQDAFIRVVDSIRDGKYKEENRFLPWVLRIARNLAIDHYRRSKRVPTSSLDAMINNIEASNFSSVSEASFEDIQIQKETSLLLKKCIEELPETQREVLMLRHFAEMSFKEIADSTGVSINTALGRMRYALINLRKKMEQNNINYELE